MSENFVKKFVLAAMGGHADSNEVTRSHTRIDELTTTIDDLISVVRKQGEAIDHLTHLMFQNRMAINTFASHILGDQVNGDVKKDPGDDFVN